jgi:hypothetical protein
VNRNSRETILTFDEWTGSKRRKKRESEPIQLLVQCPTCGAPRGCRCACDGWGRGRLWLAEELQERKERQISGASILRQKRVICGEFYSPHKPPDYIAHPVIAITDPKHTRPGVIRYDEDA